MASLWEKEIPSIPQWGFTIIILSICMFRHAMLGQFYGMDLFQAYTLTKTCLCAGMKLSSHRDFKYSAGIQRQSSWATSHIFPYRQVNWWVTTQGNRFLYKLPGSTCTRFTLIWEHDLMLLPCWKNIKGAVKALILDLPVQITNTRSCISMTQQSYDELSLVCVCLFNNNTLLVVKTFLELGAAWFSL